MSTSKPLIVVTGATSKKGGSVVRSLLKSGKYAVRALTRDASSDEAKKLSQKGAEVVATDVNDIKQLEKAFEGAHGVFAMTPVVPPSVVFEAISYRSERRIGSDYWQKICRCFGCQRREALCMELFGKCR